MPLETGHGLVAAERHDFKEVIARAEQVVQGTMTKIVKNKILDPYLPTGRPMLHPLGAFAEFRRKLIRERVKAGVAHAKAKGKRLGRPNEEIDVRRLLELRDQGSTVRAIAKGMGVSFRLVHKTLKNSHSKNLDNSGVNSQEISFH
jgi:DNA invertase Pin-like site-specific DNA recombinase